MIASAKDPFPQSDDLNDTFSAPARTDANPRLPASYKPITERIEEPCPKCRGTGAWRPGYPCFKCKGSGKLTFATTHEKRAAGRASKANGLAKKIEAFKAEHPAVWAWMDGSDFPPAIDMRAKLEKYGSLLDSRIEFANRMIEKRELARLAAIEAKATREITAPTVNANALTEAFAKATGSQKTAPKLYVAGLRIKPAKANSANAGALYVTDRATNLYLGKVINGKFFSSRDCSPEQQTAVLDVIADPKGAAVKHGKLTGTCAVCGRELTDQASIDAGIGPICATKFGW